MAWETDPLVQPQPKWESDPIIALAPVLPKSAAPAIELGPNLPMPTALHPSANPFSSGSYPLGRQFSVGDTATFRVLDLWTGQEQAAIVWQVTRVDKEADRVEINDGANVCDSMGNFTKIGNRVYSVPAQFSPAEIQVGKKWNAAYRGTSQGGRTDLIYFSFHIPRRESITVPAGTFVAFRIEGVGRINTYREVREYTGWIVPTLNFSIRVDDNFRDRWGRLTDRTRRELVSLRQHAIEN